MTALRFLKTRLGCASLVILLAFTLGLVSAGLLPGRAVAADQPACSAETAASIEVKVENVRNSKGLITAVLYGDNPEAFLKRGQRLDRIRVAAKEGETLLCLQAPVEGRYSIALYHDENGNKKFDRNFLGIPSEGYGFSNNPGFRFGKPEQKETLFTIVEDGPTSLRISILYL
ncbi:DUF2141 domain-containing protein [Pelagibius litoralis]|uniref:DUF2141 domain-containing protein n=2 Tax=Pelagibius litoralis TaxID=374515 RepID=A0A967F1U3_9PROT|nr:DUF2141 domain-containing protein [Pelagibius litoralis]